MSQSVRELELKEENNFFTPEVLVQAVKNSLSSVFQGSFYPVRVTGIVENKPRRAGAYCFLDVRGENGTRIVAKLPARLYEEALANLPSGTTLTFEGIPSVEWSSFKSAFEVLVTVSRIVDFKADDLLNGAPNRPDLLELLGRKAKKSARINVREYLKSTFRNGRKPKVVFVTGTTSVAIEDVKTSAGEALQFYDVIVSRTNILSSEAVNGELKKWIDSDADLIAVVRGGGEGLDAFNDLSLCRTALDSEKPVASAIGHSTDFSYFDLLGADVSFSVPAELGKFLKEVWEEAREEERIKKAQVELHSVVNQKESEIRDLKARVKELEEAQRKLYESTGLKEAEVKNLKTRVQELEEVQKKLRKSNLILRILLSIAAVVIFILLLFR